MRPWEQAQGQYPWQAAAGQPVYNRTLSVYRDPNYVQGTDAGLGRQGYQEAGNSNDASVFRSKPVFSSVPCSIQEASQGRNTTTDLPGDTKSVVLWRIYIPFYALAKGTVLSEDFILDDLLVRYHVTDPYWDAEGYRLFCQILET